MKTTVDISDPLFRRLREHAEREKTTLRGVIEAALRQFLGKPRGKPKPFKLKDGSFRGTGLAPGIREGDWAQVRDIIYEGHGA